MISTVEMLSGTIGRYQQKPGVVNKSAYLNSPLFYTEPTFFAMTNDQHHKMDSFLRPKQPKQQQQHMTIMKSLPHFSTPMEHVQKDPVNLAVFQSRADDDNSDQKEIIDVVGMDNNTSSSYSSSLPASSLLRAPKASYPKLSDASAYHHFNFNNFATSEPYSPHLYSQLSNHSIMAQIDFRSYLTNSENFSQQKHRQSLNVNDLISTTTSQNYSNNGGVEFQQQQQSPSSSSSSYHPTKSEINASQNYFKIPIPSSASAVGGGKESTLKHRILSNSRTTSTQQKTNGNVGSSQEDYSPHHHENENELMNFIKGSLIELSNGTLRKVEELRTEDFVMSAEKSESLQIEDSTVVKIHQPSNNSNCVIITFSYENNKSKVDIETRVEHPFFVYGQGWKSFNPHESFKSLKLECQRLQVGDICLSLKPRKFNESLNLTTKSRNHHRQQQQQQQQQNLTAAKFIFNNEMKLKNSPQEFKDGFEYDEYKKRRWSASEIYRDYENAFKKTKLTT